uniref:Arsenate reductase n=1 Tax=Pteris vittata TaxID=13821 RepID=E3UR91_PTEVI|nr:arsenate reductase [Pteris vittata]ADP20934.1 arsenate reductase [Pteris vittata]
MASLPSLSYISATDLIRLRPSSKLAIVDVRDEGLRSDLGHIAGSWNFERDNFSEKLPALMGKLEGQEAVVLHCGKSQHSGPACANKLVEHLATLLSKKEIEAAPQVYILEKGFTGWASAGLPVCTCGEAFCEGC